jgi:CHAT domain-containing protein/tetratricopeptide (TPR) repeat protein
MTRLLMLVCLAAIAQAQAPPGAERLQALARDGPQTTLVQEVRDRPDDVRPALRLLLARAATDSADSNSGPHLAAADRLAHAYAVAWRDSFLLRQVEGFRSWSAADRRIKVSADSLRLAGNDALGRSGAAAARRLWRESVRRAASIGDTAAVAAALGNVGRAFYDDNELDSAAAYWQRSADLAQRVGDARTAGNALGNLASVGKDRGDLRAAESLYARASEIRARTGDTRGLAADENNRGLIAQSLGDFSAAKRAFETALEANRKASRPDVAAVNLVNLGNLAALAGDDESADALYHEALSLFRGAEDLVGAAEVWHDIGLLRTARGDYAGAIAALSTALRTYEITGPPTAVASVRIDLAVARAAAGDLQSAVRELRRAAAAAGDVPDLLARIELARADLAVQFNRAADADASYQRAQTLFRRARDDAGEAEAIQGRGYVLLLREDYTRARDVLQIALRAQGSASVRSRAWTRLLLGYALRQSGDSGAARRVVIAALDTLRAARDAAGEATALGALADLAVRGQVGLTAESFYRRGLEVLRSAPAPNVSWPLHAGLAGALRDRGALSEATVELQAAISDIERVAGALPLEQRRASYLADKWDVYAQLASLERTRGRIDAAFEASERLRARQMLDLLARGRITWRTAGRDSLRVREQDLRLRISDLTRRLEGDQGNGELREPSAGEAAAVREALGRTQSAYADLLAAVQEAQPEYAHLVSGKVASLREVTQRLAPDEAVIEYLVMDSTTLVFVARRDTAAILDLAVGRERLASLVDFSRAALTPATRGDARPSSRAPLERLYRLLIDPIEVAGLLRGSRALVIVAHEDLHYLPFAALRKPGAANPYLVQQYVLTTVPSASVWLRLHERALPPQGGGVLALAPRADALPGTGTEVAAIARVFGPRARVLVGPEATRQAVERAASTHEIIHFATYGVLNKHNPLFSYVELAPQRNADGRLEVHDVFGLDLHARLVVLSACQTALGSGALADVPSGDDWVGLVEAFLFAGAANVLATLWPVEDRATAGFMERFYTELAGGRSEAEALAVTQRAMLRNSATASPFYWAGFSLSGR